MTQSGVTFAGESEDVPARPCLDRERPALGIAPLHHHLLVRHSGRWADRLLPPRAIRRWQLRHLEGGSLSGRLEPDAGQGPCCGFHLPILVPRLFQVVATARDPPYPLAGLVVLMVVKWWIGHPTSAGIGISHPDSCQSPTSQGRPRPAPPHRHVEAVLLRDGDFEEGQTELSYVPAVVGRPIDIRRIECVRTWRPHLPADRLVGLRRSSRNVQPIERPTWRAESLPPSAPEGQRTERWAFTILERDRCISARTASIVDRRLEATPDRL